MINSPKEKDTGQEKKSENPIQENTSVLVTSLTYLKAFPSFSMVHKPPSEKSQLLQASYNLQLPPFTLQRGCALVGSVKTYLPSNNQLKSHLFCGASHDPPT